MAISCARATFRFLEGCLRLVLLSLPPELSFFGIFSLPAFLSPAFRLISSSLRPPFNTRRTEPSVPSAFPLECIRQSFGLL